jgi:hypothetical protein
MRICNIRLLCMTLLFQQQAEEDELEMERHLSSNSAFSYAHDDSSNNAANNNNNAADNNDDDAYYNNPNDSYADNYDNYENNDDQCDELDPDDDVSTDVVHTANSTYNSATNDGSSASETDRLIQRYNARQQQQQQQPASPTTDADTDAAAVSATAAAVRSYTAADLYNLRECFEDSSDSDAAAAAVAAAAAGAATVGRGRSATVPNSYHYDEAHAAATSSATASDTEGRSAAAASAAAAAATSAGSRIVDSCDDSESAAAGIYCGMTGKYQGYGAPKQSANSAVGAVLISRAVQSAREEELCVLSLVCDAALSTVLARSAVVQLLLLLVPQPAVVSSSSSSSSSSLQQADAVRRAFTAVLSSASSRTRDAALRLLKLLVRSGGSQSHSPLEHSLHTVVWGSSGNSDDVFAVHKQQVRTHSQLSRTRLLGIEPISAVVGLQS